MDINMIIGGAAFLLAIGAWSAAAYTLEKARKAHEDAEVKRAEAKKLNDETLRTAKEMVTSQMLLVLDSFSMAVPGCTCTGCDARRAEAGVK